MGGFSNRCKIDSTRPSGCVLLFTELFWDNGMVFCFWDVCCGGGEEGLLVKSWERGKKLNELCWVDAGLKSSNTITLLKCVEVISG